MIDPIPSTWIARARTGPAKARLRAVHPVDFGQKYVAGRVVDGLGPRRNPAAPGRAPAAARPPPAILWSRTSKRARSVPAGRPSTTRRSPARGESRLAAAARRIAQHEPPALLRVDPLAPPPERQAAARRERPARVSPSRSSSSLPVELRRDAEQARERDLLAAERDARLGRLALGIVDRLQHDEGAAVRAPARPVERARRLRERLVAVRREREAARARSRPGRRARPRRPAARRAGRAPRRTSAPSCANGFDLARVRVDAQELRARQPVLVVRGRRSLLTHDQLVRRDPARRARIARPASARAPSRSCTTRTRGTVGIAVLEQHHEPARTAEAGVLGRGRTGRLRRARATRASAASASEIWRDGSAFIRGTIPSRCRERSPRFDVLAAVCLAAAIARGVRARAGRPVRVRRPDRDRRERDAARAKRRSATCSAQPPDLTISGRPLVALSLALNYALAELDPRPYRATNALMHWAVRAARCSAWCAARCARRGSPARFGARADGLALATALLFALHPLASEVGLLRQRAHRVADGASSISRPCTWRSARASPREPWGWVAGAVACCALGMASKEVMVSAPLVVAAARRGVLGRARRARAPRARGATWAGLARDLGAARGARAARRRARDSAGFEHCVTPLIYLWNQCRVLPHYLRLVRLAAPACSSTTEPRSRSCFERRVAGRAAPRRRSSRCRSSRCGAGPRRASWGSPASRCCSASSSVVPIVVRGGRGAAHVPAARGACSRWACCAGRCSRSRAAAARALRTVARRRGGARAGRALVRARRATTAPRSRCGRATCASRPISRRAHYNLGKAFEREGRTATRRRPSRSRPRACEIDVLQRVLPLQPNPVDVARRPGRGVRGRGASRRRPRRCTAEALGARARRRLRALAHGARAARARAATCRPTLDARAEFAERAVDGDRAPRRRRARGAGPGPARQRAARRRDPVSARGARDRSRATAAARPRARARRRSPCSRASAPA